MKYTDSLDYYNRNAQAFYERTIHLDMSDAQQKFLSYLPEQARILDAGCGVGRDAMAFQKLGHDVVAFDASIEMVHQSSKLLGYPTLHLHFMDMDFVREFDGVWACASLLHVAYDDTRYIFEKIQRALKAGGIFYASYKYGNEKMVVGTRTFYNMNETLLSSYLQGLFEIIAIWQTEAHPTNTQPDHNWLNLLAKKKV
ncbi:MAG TPA: methyltransferase domain-containing protein [Candidatus Nitrosotenuis sp.]|nr:methyltransferase domain-containing protein [Candidatus Nitrosotenuis sp.]